MGPTLQQIEAVQRVLYNPTRLRRLTNYLCSLDVVMNLDPTKPLQPHDARRYAGSGPNWFILANGKPAASGGADYCEKIADWLLEVRAALVPVDFPAVDKSRLRAALAAQAQAWRTRAAIWRRPAAPRDPKAAAAAIGVHDAATVRELQQVQQYIGHVHVGCRP